jgi:hypothetical protein
MVQSRNDDLTSELSFKLSNLFSVFGEIEQEIEKSKAPPKSEEEVAKENLAKSSTKLSKALNRVSSSISGSIDSKLGISKSAVGQWYYQTADNMNEVSRSINQTIDETKEIDKELGISVTAMNSLATAMDWIAESLFSLATSNDVDDDNNKTDEGRDTVEESHAMEDQTSSRSILQDQRNFDWAEEEEEEEEYDSNFALERLSSFRSVVDGMKWNSFLLGDNIQTTPRS